MSGEDLEAMVMRTSPERLRELSTHRWSEVRNQVAQNRNTPSDVLDTFAHSGDPDLMLYVSNNPSTTNETRDYLLSNQPTKHIKTNIAWWHNSQTVLAGLSRDEFVEVRRMVAKNRSTHPDDLDWLSHDKDEHVRRCVACNTSCRFETLAALKKDRDFWVRENVQTAIRVKWDNIS